MKRTPFDSGWEFRPKPNRFLEMGGRAPAFRGVTLPHDAMIESVRAPEAGGSSGFYPGGVYEYRKTFTVPEECRAHRDSLWYSGAGAHRSVHLVVGDPVHIALDGVRITTPDADAVRQVPRPRREHRNAGAAAGTSRARRKRARVSFPPHHPDGPVAESATGAAPC